MLTITEVSRTHDVSARMLRYYEQQGLIASQRREGYAYRVYDDENIARLRLILVLRKLRVPLKTIGSLLTGCDAEQAVGLLRQRISEIDEERRALEVIRDTLALFVEHIVQGQDARLSATTSERLALLGNQELLSTVSALGLSNTTLKERTLMSELNQTDTARWKSLNVRYVMLPPCRVAAFHYIGPDPEEKVGDMASRFVQESGLYELKPDARMFGFNHPNPSPDRAHYGYEVWITIPDDLDVPAPGMKKAMPGGLYAAHAIDFPNFHEWQWLMEWGENNDKYMPGGPDCTPENMFGGLEEHLNWVYFAHNRWPEDDIPGRLDLLMPIRRRSK